MEYSKINLETCRKISKEDYEKLVKGKCKPEINDVLIAKDGSYLKYVNVVKEDIDLVLLSSIAILRPDIGKIDPDFFKYYLVNPVISKRLEQGYVSGSVIRRIVLKDFKKFKIKIPDIIVQKRIARILLDLDKKIETNNEINKKLEEIAEAIFKQWFVDFEFPNEDGKPYKSSGGEMVESELGMIPNGWEVIEFMDIMNISSGKRPTKKNNEKTSEFTIPLAGASSIMGYVKEYNYDEPILVIGRVGTHGVVQRFNGKVWASDNTLVITSTYHEFTYQILNRIDYSALNRGSTQPLITQTDIKKQKIVKAKCELLNEYEKITGDIFNTINNNNKEIDKLVLLRDTLLPKLMSGEIRVPVEN